MKVHLKRNWFGPNGNRVRKSVHAADYRELPDEWRDKLPPGATVLEKGEKLPPVPKEPEGNLLRQMDGDRAAAEAEGEVIEKAEDAAAEFRKRLEAEKAEGTRDTAAPVTRGRFNKRKG